MLSDNKGAAASVKFSELVVDVGKGGTAVSTPDRNRLDSHPFDAKNKVTAVADGKSSNPDGEQSDDGAKNDKAALQKTAKQAALDALDENVIDIIDDIVEVDEEELSSSEEISDGSVHVVKDVTFDSAVAEGEAAAADDGKPAATEDAKGPESFNKEDAGVVYSTPRRVKVCCMSR